MLKFSTSVPVVLVYLSLADKTVLHLPSLGFRSEEESLAHSCAEGRGLLHSALWFTSVDCEKQFHTASRFVLFLFLFFQYKVSLCSL